MPLTARLKRLEGLGAGVWTKEKRKRPFSSERHKTNQRSGVLCHIAGAAYDPKSWALESGQHNTFYKSLQIIKVLFS
ncbi:hypothetical protein DP120_00705 [Planococcus halotolerans]|uniref:Uncharacterized protein n=1 Tax=Planococcus halotolerans TaxID=2233542 RepID=A0A365L640_9BACL|nr:hypothetical protein DP120_00705 [Planococcus halotolerans]